LKRYSNLRELKNVLFPLFFIPIFKSYNKTSLEDAANDIAFQFKYYHGKRLFFLGTEIAKDLSYFSPGKIDPDSKCRMNLYLSLQ